MKFITFAGSIRPRSLNHHLSVAVQNALKERGYECEEIELDDYELPLYSAVIENVEGVPANAVALVEKFKEAKGIFIACPEYNASITPLLKNTLDWMSRVQENGKQTDVFSTRVFAIGAASPGGFGGYRGLIAVRQVLELGLGALTLPQMISVPKAHEVLAEDGVISDERTIAILSGAVENFVNAASKY